MLLAVAVFCGMIYIKNREKMPHIEKRKQNELILKLGQSFLVVVFVVLLTCVTGAWATYNPGDTLEPSCAPGEAGCTLVSPLSSMQTITLSGDLSGSGTTALAGTIASDAVEESMLKAVDAASDEECLTYETTTGDFEWQSCGSAYTAGGTLLNLSSNTFSLHEGTLTDGKGCSYATGTGLVCNSDYLTSVDISSNTNLSESDTLLSLSGDTLSVSEGTLTNNYFCTYESGTGLVCNTASAGNINYFTETESTASPNDTVYVDSLTASGVSTHVDFIVAPKGSGALLAAIPDSTATGGNKRGSYSVDLQRGRTAAAQVAAADYSIIGGGADNKIEVGSDYSIIGGGYNNAITTANSDYSAIGGGRDNTIASSAYGVIGGGRSNSLSGDYSSIGGGYGNTIDNKSYALIGSGYYNTVSSAFGVIVTGRYNNITSTAYRAFIGSGDYNEVSAYYAGILTGSYGKADKYGQHTQASGRFAALGDAQTSELIARKQTTDGTEGELLLDNSALRATIATDTTWYYDVMIVGRRTDADNESALYRYRGVIDNNAGTTALVGSQQTKLAVEDTAAWACTVTADDTNDALAVKCTGEAAKTINWVAKIRLTEVSG